MALRTGILFLIASLVAITLPGAHAASNGDAERARDVVAALDKDFDSAQESLNEELGKIRRSDAYKEARKARDFQKTRAMSDKVITPFKAKWREKYTEAGAAYKGKDAEILFASAMLGKRLLDDPAVIVREIITAHAASPLMVELAPDLRYQSRGFDKEEFRSLLATLIEKNESQEVKAHAYFARAFMVRYDRDASDEERKAAEADLAKVVEIMPKDSLLSMKARGPEFQKARLQIGMEVPDIEGVDIDGKKFNLSDYRGKVVMLDFWGDW